MKYLLILLGLFVHELHAVDVSAEYKQSKYYVTAVFEIEANASTVITALTDYENITQFNPAIIEVEVLSSEENNFAKVRTKIKDCVLFFCKEITRVEHVQVNGTQALETEVLPFLSDLREGYTHWNFSTNGAVTEVTYESVIQPKFWIPPLIRSHSVTKKIKKRMLQTIQRLQILVPAYE